MTFRTDTDLLDEHTRETYRQLVAAGIDGAGRPSSRSLVRPRASGTRAADY